MEYRGGVNWEGEEWGWRGMDGFGVGWGEKERKTKEGEWRVEPGCEMTLLEHGFKHQNKGPVLGVRLI